MDIQTTVRTAIPPSTDGGRVLTPARDNGVPPVAEKAKPAVDSRPDPVSLQHAVDNINKLFRQNDTTVQFSIDRDTKRNVVKMLDSSTGEVIRQYPSEVTLAISQAIDEQIKQGVLLNQKA